MSGLLVAELRKISTTRSGWILAVTVFVLSAAFAAVPAAFSLIQADTLGRPPFADPASVWSIYNGGNTAARILALVVGVLAIGGEYRHRTIVNTFLATPRRRRVVVAKAAALTVFGAGYGGLSVLADVGVAVPFVLSQDASFYLDRADTWRSLLLGVVSLALWALIGLAVGLLIRNFLVALLVGIGFSYLVEPTLSAVLFVKGWTGPLNLLPSGATNAMLGLNSPVLLSTPDPWPWWAGLLVLLGWCLVPATIGMFTALRRDV